MFADPEFDLNQAVEFYQHPQPWANRMVLGDSLLDQAALSRLAEVAPREELLARLAGGMAAPMQNFASLLNAIPQKMAYALQALIEQGGAATSPTTTDEPTAEADPADTAAAEVEAPAETEAENTTDQDETPADGDAVEASADDAAQEEE